MNLSSTIKSGINGLLSPLHLRLETLTAEEHERQRLAGLYRQQYFQRPVFTVPDAIRHSDWRRIAEAALKYRPQLDRLQTPDKNDVGFCESNTYYHPPDSDVLYTFVREFRPARIVEIGSGNSTRLIRQAIRDGGLTTHVISIDPMPRTDIAGFTDEVRSRRVEEIPPDELAGELHPGDVLFIDSSHMVAVGNDCVYEYLQLLPRIRPGVIVHVHDILLPWDYPWDWIQGEPQIGTWCEQYLLQAMLVTGNAFEVLWPGHYVQRTTGSEFATWFPRCGNQLATSFWMRRR